VKLPPLVLVVGAPRSGTTWLQHLLGAHPAIVTPQETDVFAHYLGPLVERWRGESSEARIRRHRGLPAVLTQEQFLELMRDLLASIYGPLLERKPGASMVLDKSPDHSRSLGAALAIVPDVLVVHAIRDGRDVACSLVRASVRDWGSGWAPGRVAAGAETWREFVQAARKGGELTERYVEVRYEQLHSADAPHVLAQLYAFCGLEPDLELARDTLHRFDLDRTRSLPPNEQPSSIVWGGEILRRFGDRPEEPEGFLGDGRGGGWRGTLDAYERIAFDRVAGELLIELGYEPDSSWVEVGAAGRTLAPLAHHSRRALRRLRRTMQRPR
jgi:hypothetical protein